MKQKVLMMMVVVAMGLVSCSARDGVQQKETKSSDGLGLVLTDEEQKDFLSLFESYLATSKERGASTIRFMAENGSDADGQEQYKRNQQHVDSVMSSCVELMKSRAYERLYDLLEKERKNIQQSPGNSVENYLGLTALVRKMNQQKYGKDLRTCREKVLPWDEFGVLMMDLMKAMGKGTHPDYVEMLMRVALDYEVMEQNDLEMQGAASLQNTLEAWHRVAEASSEEGYAENFIASMIHLGGLYKQVGLKESADSCINAVKDLPGFDEISKELGWE